MEKRTRNNREKKYRPFVAKLYFIKMRILVYILILYCSLSSCTKDGESQESGSAVFYTTGNTHGTTSITITGDRYNPLTFTLPVTTDPNFLCESARNV